MKQILQKNIIFFLLSFNILHAQQTIPVLYAPCENCNSGNHNENNHNFQYGAIREFDTEHVTSDFGPGNYRTYDWHGGVDYSPEGSNEDFGEILQSVVPRTKVAKEQACLDKRCKTIS